MKRVWFQGLLVMAVISAVCGSTTTAQAQWGYGYYGGPAVVVQPYVAYSAPAAYGGYGYGGIGYGGVNYGGYGAYGYGGYGAAPAVVRDHYNYGVFGHLNHHHHAHGYGLGHQHYHTRYPYGW